ncbi:MAG: 50S ribosomal protein L17 [Mariprofundaceae bacterium]
MRHRKHHGSLGLVSSHRRALLANLAAALFTHGRINTTQAKARAMQSYVEKLISLGKRGDLHARRQALAKLKHRGVVDQLFAEVAPGYATRPGGYTRIIKGGFRVGDAAPMALIELVEAGEVKTKTKKSKPKAAKPAAKPEAKVEAKAEAGTEETAATEEAAEPVEAKVEDAAESAAPAEEAAAEPEAEKKDAS